jgi:hypothetical protein
MVQSPDASLDGHRDFQKKNKLMRTLDNETIHKNPGTSPPSGRV